MTGTKSKNWVKAAAMLALATTCGVLLSASQVKADAPKLEIRNSAHYDLTVTWGTGENDQPNSMGRMSPNDTDTAGEVVLGGHYWATGKYGDGNTVTADIVIGSGRNIIDLK